MKKRPTSITVIAWILIVMGGLSLITTTVNINNPIAKELMSRSPIPLPIQHVMLYAGMLVTLISGIAMLKGQNWARFLYVIWSIIGFVIAIVTSPMKATIIPGFVGFLVVAFFLFRPKANEYFSGAEVQSGTKSD
jgi:cytochrome b561